MDVRLATEEDAAAVAALWTEAYSDDPRGGRMAPYAPTEFHNAAKAGEVLVADDGCALHGVVAIYEAGVRDGQIAREGEAELSRLAVSRRARRGGLGRRLIESCLELAADQRASALVLWSQPHQIEAHKLYTTLGFRRQPDRDDEDVNGPRLVFARSL